MRKIAINITIGFIIVLLVVVGIFFLTKKETDASKFKKEYEQYNEKTNESNKKYTALEIDKKNPIKYASYTEIMNILNAGTGIIYFGFPECPWCRALLPSLLEISKEQNINKIYYYNALSIRDQKHLDDKGNIITDKEGTKEYYELVEKLYDALDPYDGLKDETIKRLYFPTVVFVKNGEIVGVHSSTVTSQTDPYETLTKEQQTELKDILKKQIEKIYPPTCDSKEC